MADLGWVGILMRFDACDNPKAAAQILADELRSDRPLSKWDREELARLIEGSRTPLPDACCEVKVARRRDRKKLRNDLLALDALARMDELCENEGMTVEKAAEIAAASINIHSDTLRKKYPAYRVALLESKLS